MKIGDKIVVNFVHNPLVIADLQKPFDVNKQTECIIKYIVELDQIAFENFATDMSQWREFLDEYPYTKRNVMPNSSTYEAILVCEKCEKHGILVVGKDYPEWCAYVPEV